MGEESIAKINEVISMYYDGDISADHMAIFISYIVNFEQIRENKRK